MPTRIYEFGLQSPDVNADLVFEQMRLGSRHYNKLIEIEHERRNRVRATLAAHPDVDQIAEDVKRLFDEREQARQKINLVRKTTRSRKAPSELIEAVKTLSVALKARREEMKAAKTAILSDVVVQQALAEHDDWAKECGRKARAASGLYWGDYLIVEQAMDAARKSKVDPQFRKFSGDGRVSVQVQGGISVEELFGNDTQVQIVTRSSADPTLDEQIASKVAERADLRTRWKASCDPKLDPTSRQLPSQEKVAALQRWKASGDRELLLAARALSKEIYALRTQNVGHRRDSQRASLHGHEITSARLRLRVQSDPKGHPVWAEWPMTISRPLPEKARIKVVTVQKRRRDSVSHEWRVHIMLDVNECRLGQPGEGACALNLGWCKKPDGGLRVGYIVGHDGVEHECVLPHSIIDRVEKSESIHQRRDLERAEMIAKLGPWISQHRESAPAWFQEHVKTFHAWKSPRRFAKLAWTWKTLRLDRKTDAHYGGRWDGDEEGYQLLEAWHKRDCHLEQYEAGLRRGAHRHRRDIYRCFAKQLAERYHTLVIDDTDLRKFQRDPKPEDKRNKIDAVARNQGHAAPFELRLALVSAFMRAGAVQKLSSVNVTRRHVWVPPDGNGSSGAPLITCDSIEDWDRASPIREHTCSSCGQTYDQDANACRNLLREHRGSTDGSAPARESEVPVPKKETRSDRLRRSRWKKEPPAPLAP